MVMVMMRMMLRMMLVIVVVVVVGERGRYTLVARKAPRR
jgi:hypothetical protein